MTLEDFEKSLADDRRLEEGIRPDCAREGSKKHHRHHRRHYEDGEHQPRHKRRKHSRDNDESISQGQGKMPGYTSERTRDVVQQEDNEEWVRKDMATLNPPGSSARSQIKRDSWMEAPSALDIDYVQKGARKSLESTMLTSSKADFELKIHENELNKHHLQNLADGNDIPGEVAEKSAEHKVDYCFGDSGAHWRMTKLKGVYRRSEQTGRPIDDVAREQFGDLRSFDDAREEQIELERRDTYGEGYVGKEKPSGELFEERKLDMGLQNDHSTSIDSEIDDENLPRVVDINSLAPTTVPMDQTALNRLKAQMLKAKIRGSADAANLEIEYNNTLAAFANRKQPDVVVLGAMDSRMLAGGRKGEIKNIENKRGRERGLVEENEDMSIEDMVRQERRSRNQAGGDGQRFAESIAKDAKFDVRKSFQTISYVLTFA